MLKKATFNRGTGYPENDFKQCAFACAIFTNNAKCFAFLNFELHIAEAVLHIAQPFFTADAQ